MAAQMSVKEFYELLAHLDKIEIWLKECSTISTIPVGELSKNNNYWRNHIVGYTKSNKLHPTEEKYPEQTKTLRELLDQVYKTHLEKNLDYSPYNIKATGMHGIMTRIWDKTARLMNLMGFNIGTGEYFGEKQEQNESKEQNFLDASHYFLIALIYRAGKWGK